MTFRMRTYSRLAVISAMTTLAALSACKKTQSAGGEVSRNWTPPKADAYMGVAAADVQNALTTRLAAKGPESVSDDQWKHVKKLYAAFGQQLLWLDAKGVHQPRVKALLTTVAGADSDAIDLTKFPLPELNRTIAALGDKPTAQQLAEADVMLSSTFAEYGETMFNGQVDPVGLGQAWHINTTETKVDSALSLSMREDDFSAALQRMRPQDPAYDSLRMELANYRALAAKGGWQPIPSGGLLKRGSRDATRIAALRARLKAEGYLADDSTTAPVFDKAVSAAIAQYQARHSIMVDSALGAETLESMNLPTDYRVAQIAANLERYRWMPRDLGQRYVLVNVPQFYLHAFDSGQKSLDMKVIVGKEYEDKATPVFADSMETVVFRPYWNVTPTIAAKEIFPKAAADPNYLAANNMEVYNDHGRQAVRQLPGDKNSLGLVKFLFPNDFNIYLHDTPEHGLFNKDERAFSHGCIRVEKPAELAQWVLGWDAGRVDAAMHGQDNHAVQLPKKIPVYIVYFTAFVQDGHLNFGNDLYDRDSKLVAEMKSATPTPETRQAQDSLRTLANGE